MRIWAATFVILFSLAELYQWFSHLKIPLPVFILGGVALAIVSNYGKQGGIPFRSGAKMSFPVSTSLPSQGSSTLLTETPQVPQPISFKIQKPEQT
ncbi:MAG: hypothetical protein SFW36_03155 [Leptolyngbyaceae cyanobacterium bins.59]|nr:hypothetical protein [Leptolyngbyaceae cyanobacterium bins.59]